jgi:hypothetical protein
MSALTSAVSAPVLDTLVQPPAYAPSVASGTVATVEENTTEGGDTAAPVVHVPKKSAFKLDAKTLKTVFAVTLIAAMAITGTAMVIWGCKSVTAFVASNAAFSEKMTLAMKGANYVRQYENIAAILASIYAIFVALAGAGMVAGAAGMANDMASPRNNQTPARG